MVFRQHNAVSYVSGRQLSSYKNKVHKDKSVRTGVMSIFSSWIKSAAKPRKPSRKQSTRSKRKSQPSAQQFPFRAVAIHSPSGSCEAAERIRGQRFLAAHAPQIPLGGCSHGQQCNCRYKYFTDRRSDMRRNTDHGLPSGPFHGDERRYRRDRRRQRHTPQARLA